MDIRLKLNSGWYIKLSNRFVTSHCNCLEVSVLNGDTQLLGDQSFERRHAAARIKVGVSAELKTQASLIKKL